MELPFKTPRERGVAIAIVALWALLFLPGLRTNPNWYGDEGVTMEMSWTMAHGHPRLGALTHDGFLPTPYPPLYLMFLGSVLRVFGNDILVGRALQALAALATVGILFWVGTRLKGKRFGVLCALAFMVYPEVVMHYRWVRMHPMTGTLALASVGFMIRYIQERKVRDIALAGLLCTLAVGTHYFIISLMGLVVFTALCVNWRHVPVALGTLALYPVGFAGWYVATQGGLDHFLARAHQAFGMATGDVQTSWFDEAARLYQLMVQFLFTTPTSGPPVRSNHVDLWLPIATVGMLCFPEKRMRKWLAFWFLVMVYWVLRTRNNVAMFFYPAMVFVPFMAVGFAGAVEQLSEWAEKIVPKEKEMARRLPAFLLLGGFGVIAVSGSLGQLRSKIDLWTLHEPASAEAAMAYVNANTGPDDYVIMPDQLFWLYPHEKRAQLVQAAHYAGIEKDYYGDKTLPHDIFWFDCSWQKAKYCVLAYGMDKEGKPFGIDAVFWLGFKGVRKIVEDMQAERWPVVFHQGEFMVLANPKFLKKEEKK